MEKKRKALKISKSLLMKWTWKLYRKQNGNTDEQFSECLKLAWSVIRTYDFGKIYDRYYAGLCYYVSRKKDNFEAIEEVVNDAFVRMNENYILYNSEIGNVGSWLYGMADNSYIDYYRKNKKHTTNVSISEYVDDNGKETMQIADDFATDEELERNETTELIRGIFNKVLTEKQRKVAELRYIYDYSYEQIVNELNISMADVKANVRRAKIALQNENVLKGIYNDVCTY